MRKVLAALFISCLLAGCTILKAQKQYLNNTAADHFEKYAVPKLIELLDEKVAAGKLTKEQADIVKAQLPLLVQIMREAIEKEKEVKNE